MRKRLGIFSGGWSGEFTQEVLAGIIDVTYKNDIDTFVFMNFSIRADMDFINIPEVNIFKMPDMRDFDAIILVGNSFNRQEEIDYLLSEVRKAKKPCISIEYDFGDIPFISTDNYAGMRDLVDHMLEVHKIKTFLYIGGPEEHPEAAERLVALKDSMASHGMEIPEGSIKYADWSKALVPGLIEEWVEENNGDYPEAIICANDMMAIATMSYLKEHGVTIPERVKVTGYDCIRLALIQSPPISSVNHEWNSIGVAAAQNIIAMINGETVEHQSKMKTRFVCAGSCGCKVKHNLLAYNELGRALTNNVMDPIDLDSHFRHFYSSVRKPKSKQELYHSLSDMFEKNHILEGESFKLCIDPGFFEIRNGEQNLLTTGYREYYDVIASLAKGKYQTYRQLPLRTCIFESAENADEPGYYLYFPIYIDALTVGFAMLSGALNVANENQFYIWTRHMNTALEQVKGNLLLAVLWDELMNQSVTDALTGVYNRHGCQLNTYPQMIEWTKQGGTSVIMLVDVDNMKTINDKFGHACGDEALITITKIIKMLLPEDFAISRFGGDEFFIGGTLKDPNMDIDLLIERMEKALSGEVINKKIEYPLTMSIGFAKIQPNSVVDIEKAIVRADEGMYNKKKLHHSKQ